MAAKELESAEFEWSFDNAGQLASTDQSDI